MTDREIILPHGGYRKLMSYQMSTVVFDYTYEFVQRYIDQKSRTRDQMEQAARSGKQDIVEGTMASGTSKKTEIKLLGVARASLEELLIDYEDFLRRSNLPIWGKYHSEVAKIRKLGYMTDKSYMTYMSYIGDKESAANCALCLIHQTNYLLDQQIRSVEKEFLEKGGLTERLYKARTKNRSY